MTRISFYLRDKKALNKTSVLAAISWSHYRIRIATGVALSPELWNNKTAMPVTLPASPAAELATRKLLQFRLQYEKVIFDLQYFLERPPTPLELSQKLSPELEVEKPDAPERMSFNQFVLREIVRIGEELHARGINNRHNLTLSYQNSLKLLSEFNKSKPLQFADINHDFYTRFLNYCTQVKAYKPNNIGKHIKNIKALMNRSFKLGFHENQAFRHFSKPVENVETIYLDIAEIGKIAALVFTSEMKHLETSRDLFVVACWTGLRYSDWRQFASLDLMGDMVTVTAQKTGKPIVIPLHPQVKEIAAKYQYKLPAPKNNVVINRDLKEIGKLAGIDGITTLNEIVGGQKRIRKLEKYKLITCHTSRRSFATNLYNMGVSAIDIMQITGHKTETTFMKYIRISRQEAASRIYQQFYKNNR
jgi:integrase